MTFFTDHTDVMAAWQDHRLMIDLIVLALLIGQLL